MAGGAAWVLLLRGINVGGSGKLPMASLRGLLAELGCRKIATFIQSGNAVFVSELDRAHLSEAIGRAIETAHGFRPGLFLLSAAELQAALDANPFPQAEADPKPMHLIFHDGAATPDRPALDALLADGESWEITDRVLYLRATNGIGRSKFAANLARHFKAQTTARNLHTCRRLLAMVLAAGR